MEDFIQGPLYWGHMQEGEPDVFDSTEGTNGIEGANLYLHQKPENGAPWVSEGPKSVCTLLSGTGITEDKASCRTAWGFSRDLARI